MTDWTEVANWFTTVGVEYQIEERYNRSDDVYELRMSKRANETWFVADKWRSEAGWCPDE